MPKLTVIIPTVTGRERVYKACLGAYSLTSPKDTEFLVYKDLATCGLAWRRGLEDAMGDFIHITADDIIPEDGWFEVAQETALNGQQPAPLLLNPDGTTFSFGHGGGDATILEDKKPTFTSVLPFVKREWVSFIQPMVGWHYFTDDYVSEKLRRHGIQTVCRLKYEFCHDPSPIGRLPDRMEEDYQNWMDYMGRGV